MIASPRLRVGVDLVRVSRVEESIATFGERFVSRVFTEGEIAYADGAPGAAERAERLAARFAAKEATIKALSLTDVGTDWCAIEVVKDRFGAPSLVLHGAAAAAARAESIHELSLSLSHEGDQAIAVVVAQSREPRE